MVMQERRGGPGPSSRVRIGVVTAFPPGRNSLNDRQLTINALIGGIPLLCGNILLRSLHC